MKFGYDEVTQGVRLNDAMSDATGAGLPEIAKGFDVDLNAVQHVSTQRAMMAERMVFPKPTSQLIVRATLASCWMDGFFAALHMMEQKEAEG